MEDRAVIGKDSNRTGECKQNRTSGSIRFGLETRLARERIPFLRTYFQGGI